MPDLLVTCAVPNPAGKDRSIHGVNNDQLNGEWVEFLNTTRGTFSLEGVALIHRTFNQYCEPTGDSGVTSFFGSLASGKSIRVHTGSGTDFWSGDLLHTFLNRGNYVWNNACGDVVILQKGTTTVDWAAYGKNPTGGKVLTRVSGQNYLA